MHTGEETEAQGFGSRATGRLVLRPAGRGDAEAAEALAAGGGHDLADARAWINRARILPGAVVRTIVEAGTGSMVGAAGIAPMADHPGRLELSLWIAPGFAGRGYGTEAAHALIDAMFCRTGAGALWGVCRVTNGAARRVMEKCGFQAREHGMARSVALRGAVPVERFALERRTWAGLRAWGGLALDRGEDGEAQVPAA